MSNLYGRISTTRRDNWRKRSNVGGGKGVDRCPKGRYVKGKKTS